MKKKEKLIDKAIIINNNDNVATARAEIPVGTILILGNNSITVKDNIPFGHKLALKNIPKGEPIIKYGQRIGIAIKDIFSGELVHIHNVSGERGMSR
ncbi:MAG: UxaA family hydrolase [bacterium]